MNIGYHHTVWVFDDWQSRLCYCNQLWVSSYPQQSTPVSPYCCTWGSCRWDVHSNSRPMKLLLSEMIESEACTRTTGFCMFCRWTVCQLDVSVCGCGSKWKTDVGPQMWKSSLVLTIHKFWGTLILTHPHVSVISLNPRGRRSEHHDRADRWTRRHSVVEGSCLRKRGGCSVDACSATFYKFYSNIISWRISFLKDSESLFSRLIHFSSLSSFALNCVFCSYVIHTREHLVSMQLFCNVCLMQETNVGSCLTADVS